MHVVGSGRVIYLGDGRVSNADSTHISWLHDQRMMWPSSCDIMRRTPISRCGDQHPWNVVKMTQNSTLPSKRSIIISDCHSHEAQKLYIIWILRMFVISASVNLPVIMIMSIHFYAVIVCMLVRCYYVNADVVVNCSIAFNNTVGWDSTNQCQSFCWKKLEVLFSFYYMNDCLIRTRSLLITFWSSYKIPEKLYTFW